MHICVNKPQSVNTLKLRQNGRHTLDNIFKGIFRNENINILINSSRKSVPKEPINNIPALVQMMVWRWPSDKPLSEPTMVSLLMCICITQPQWVKIPFFSRSAACSNLLVLAKHRWNKVLLISGRSMWPNWLMEEMAITKQWWCGKQEIVSLYRPSC